MTAMQKLQAVFDAASILTEKINILVNCNTSTRQYSLTTGIIESSKKLEQALASIKEDR